MCAHEPYITSTCKLRLGPDADQADREFWAALTPAERVLETWRLSLELWELTFQEAWTSRVEGPVGDTRCPDLGREALVRNQRAVGRPRGLADLEALGE